MNKQTSPTTTDDVTLMPNAATADRTVIIDRGFAGPPSRVFAAWIDPALAVKWFGPEGFTTSEIVIEPHPGGRWANVMTAPDGTRYASTGEIRDIVPAKRLVIFDDGKAGPERGHATKITVTFEPSGTGTAITLVHGVFKTKAMRDECARGWTSTFDRLERLMRGDRIEPV